MDVWLASVRSLSLFRSFSSIFPGLIYFSFTSTSTQNAKSQLTHIETECYPHGSIDIDLNLGVGVFGRTRDGRGQRGFGAFVLTGYHTGIQFVQFDRFRTNDVLTTKHNNSSSR